MLDQTFQRSFAISVHIVKFPQVRFSAMTVHRSTVSIKAGLTIHGTL